MSILVFSPNGTYITKPTLEVARTSADCAGKTVVVTSALTAAQSNITSAWPTDRALEVKNGGSITNTTTFTINGPFSAGNYQVFSGSGTVTGLKESRPEWFGNNAVPGTTDMTTAVQGAFIASDIVVLRGMYKTTSYANIREGQHVTGGGTIINTVSDHLWAESVSNWTVENIKFSGAPTYAAIRTWDTTAPCSNINITNNSCTNIKLLNSYRFNIDLVHGGGVPYAYVYYSDSSKISKNWTIANNTGRSLSWVEGGAEMFIQCTFVSNITITGNSCSGYRDGIQIWNGDWNKAGWTTDARVGGTISISGNTMNIAKSGISVISSTGVNVTGNTVLNGSMESLDAEASRNIVFSGNVADNVLMGFCIFNNIENIVFDSNSVILQNITGAVAMYSAVLSNYAEAGEVRVTNNNIRAISTNLGQFPLGTGVKSWVIKGNTFQNIYFPGSNSTNHFEFANNTIIHDVAPPSWSLATPSMTTATFNFPELLPKCIIRGNTWVNRLASGKIGTCIEIQNTTVASNVEISNNYIDGDVGVNIPDPGATAIKNISIFNNILNVKTTPIKSPVNTNATDRVFYRDNVNELGKDAFQIPQVTGLTGSSAMWAAGGINIPFQTGSTIMVYDPAAVNSPGYMCVTAGVQNGGTGVWKPMGNLQ